MPNPREVTEPTTQEEAVEALVRHGARHALVAVKTIFQRVIALQAVRGTAMADHPLMGVLQALVDTEQAFIEQVVGVAVEELRRG